MKVVATLLWLVYAVIFAAMGRLAYIDDHHLGYPAAFVYSGVTSYALGSIGIVLHGIGVRRSWLMRAWKWVVFLMLAVLAVGLGMDAVLPQDFNLSNGGLQWVMNAVLNVAIIAPGFLANWWLWKPRGG